MVNKNKFTRNAVKSINYAAESCLALGNAEVRLEHLFMGILKVKDGIGIRILSSVGVDPEATLANLEKRLGGGGLKLEVDNSANVSGDGLDSSATTETESVQGEVPEQVLISAEVKSALDKAYDYALEWGHVYVGTEHILLGILSQKDSSFVKELNNVGLTFDVIKSSIENTVQYPTFVDHDWVSDDLRNKKNHVNADDSDRGKGINYIPVGGGPSILETLGRNLTLEARLGKLDPVIGRDKEINRIMQILSRRRKNNPILLGDAGVGKTAVVEGLALRLISDDVSPLFSNFEIWSVDTAIFVAGSHLRGDLESKMLDFIREVERRNNVIIFIDEIHTIVGAGSTASNPMDIGNILKPALAKGTLRCIGATTIDEYKKFFDEDPALQRRFQPVEIDELSEASTIEVLKNLRPRYESYHNVRITNSALEAAVKLSARYITDRYLPDKAIDLIDEACARNRLERVRINDEFKKYLRDLREVMSKKDKALRSKDIEEASGLLDVENSLVSKLKKVEKKLKKEWNSSSRKSIKYVDIRRIVADWVKMPLIDEIPLSEQISKLQESLRKNIIGQDYAIDVVVNAVRRAKVGLSGLDKPLASFLFIGPTGVGKTELARELAKSLFGSKDALVQVDMSELMEPHSVSKLIGAPPGYVGFDEGGQLTGRVRRRPFSVVLFDEIEKADPEVLNILLQILDEGRLTDSKGRLVNFKNTIIVMTSNIGSELFFKDNRLGIRLSNDRDEKGENINSKFSLFREKVIDELRDYLSPEFLNRIDDLVLFRKLNRNDVLRIARLHIGKFVESIRKANKINLNFSSVDKIVERIVDIGYSEEYGAREVKRLIKELIENPLAEFLISNGFDPGKNKLIDIDARWTKWGIKFEVSEKQSSSKIAISSAK